MESQIGESRAALAEAYEEYKGAVEKLGVESQIKQEVEARASAPRGAAVKLAEVLDGKFDIGQPFQIDTLEEFENAEYDISELIRRSLTSGLSRCVKGVQDMSKQLFEKLSESVRRTD